MRLVGDPKEPRLVTGKTKIDVTEQMKAWIPAKLDQLEKEDLVAFIFKAKSPSSGFYSAKVYSPEGPAISHKGKGIFAGAFAERFPDIPVEEEGRLHDPALRERFIETIFVLQNWREKVKRGKPGDLVEFHSNHKYAFMAHDPEKLKEMGKLTASIGQRDFSSLRDEYFQAMVSLLAVQKTTKKNYNVLLHVVGYFKKNITPDEKQELLATCQQYYEEIVPLVVPLTLIRHYARKYQEEYLLKQTYLNPHPAELGLLNHV